MAKIWLLNDGRVGNYRQLEAIGYYLDKHIEIVEKNVEFNKTVSLPNILRFFFGPGLSKSSKKDLSSDFPDMVISAGRRCAPISLWIKKKSNGKAKTVQIMKPDMPAKNFDFIITPKHDHFKHSNYEYSITPNLVMDRIKETSENNIHFDKTGKNYAVYIGGGSKNKKISQETYMTFISKLKEVKKYTGCKFYISTSRRTNKAILGTLKAEFKDDFVYDFMSKMPNPHYELLQKSDQIFVTGDSISMISEAISSGKPTIFFPEFSAQKHADFTAPLISQKLAISFNEYSANRFSTNTVSKDIPNEAKIIAEKILAFL